MFVKDGKSEVPNSTLIRFLPRQTKLYKAFQLQLRDDIGRDEERCLFVKEGENEVPNTTLIRFLPRRAQQRRAGGAADYGGLRLLVVVLRYTMWYVSGVGVSCRKG